MSTYLQNYVYYAQASSLCWQVCATLAAATYFVDVLGCSWLAAFPLNLWQVCAYHCELLPAVAQLRCMIVEMRLAAASWQSNNC